MWGQEEAIVPRDDVVKTLPASARSGIHASPLAIPQFSGSWDTRRVRFRCCSACYLTHTVSERVKWILRALTEGRVEKRDSDLKIRRRRNFPGNGRSAKG